MVKKILLVLLAALVIIQFFRPDKNIATGEQPNTLAKAYSVPSEVKSLLEVACNDCHSNNTRYPWYNNIQPVAWWLNGHVKEGKEHLNFDEFLAYPPKRQDHKMEEVIEMVEKSEMPLRSYTWTHKDARLTTDQVKLILDWARQVRTEISAKTGFTPEKKEEDSEASQ